MKHHFADFLDRENDYWTIVPNRERYAYNIDKIVKDKIETTIVTISKHDLEWRKVFELKGIEELTLHEPSKEQIEVITEIKHIKRLRVTHLRTKDINFIGELSDIEELVLEYVSGFSDLSPLKKLKKLKSVHVENLRKVKDFSGLSGINSLRYLYITGTLDWNQPIESFEFLGSIPNLEVIDLGWFSIKQAYPATLPFLKLKKLKKLSITSNYLDIKEFAILEEGLNGVEGATWKPYYSIMYSSDDPSSEWYEFLGKRAGRAKASKAETKQKCLDYQAYYEELKINAKKLIESQNGL